MVFSKHFVEKLRRIGNLGEDFLKFKNEYKAITVRHEFDPKSKFVIKLI